MNIIEFEFTWFFLILIGLWQAPELMKSLVEYVVIGVFSTVVTAYWWASNKIIREIWQT